MPNDYPWLKSYPSAVDWRAHIPVLPVHDMLDRTASRFPDRPAFDFLGRIWRWREIAREVDSLAAGLMRLGLGKGGKVGLLLPNSPYFLIAYYAILRAGGTVVNLNPLYSEAELAHMIADSETDILITADLKILMDKAAGLTAESRLGKIVVCDFAASLPPLKHALFRLFKRKDLARPAWSDRVVRLRDVMRGAGLPPHVAIDPLRDIALLQYTGGTTGAPKGAMLTHANVSSNAEQCRLWFTGTEDGAERTLGVIPFFHVFAMTAVMNLSVLRGWEIVALPRFDLKNTLRLIAQKRPSFFPAVPAIYNAINHGGGGYDLTSLKYCVSGGAPLPGEVKTQFEARTGAVLVEGYGLTETSPVACVNPVGGLNKTGSIGLPLPGTIVEIRHPDTGDLMPQGEAGELCIRGPQVMRGYWKNEAETAKVLKDGRLHTGDIARIDEDGYVFIVDRLKDMIITNGYKVYPRNVEEVIYRHPKIEECIVAGLPDPQRGEAVKAWVKPKAGETVTGDELKTWLKDKVSPMELPRQIEVRDRPLPKTMIGKLSRKDIVAEEKAKVRGD